VAQRFSAAIKRSVQEDSLEEHDFFGRAKSRKR